MHHHHRVRCSGGATSTKSRRAHTAASQGAVRFLSRHVRRDVVSRTRTSQAAGDVDDALRGRRPAFADPGRDVSRYVGVSGTP